MKWTVLFMVVTGVGSVKADETLPWGKGESLAERTQLEKTGVCTDGKNHYVVVAPHEKQSRSLYYGDGKKFVKVPLPPWVLSGDHFFDPRFFAKSYNPDFRGLDMRLFSSVDYNAEKNSCVAQCGERKTELKVLSADEKKALVLKGEFGDIAFKRQAYRLARDNNGNYYYVDKGSTPETEKSFRLFVGPKGRMKLQKMTNTVADSEGEIFSTKTGQLKYVLSADAAKHPPVWIVNGKKFPLTSVPIEDREKQLNNYQLIFNELGVYLGEKLGTPCDDL